MHVCRCFAVQSWETMRFLKRCTSVTWSSLDINTIDLWMLTTIRQHATVSRSQLETLLQNSWVAWLGPRSYRRFPIGFCGNAMGQADAEQPTMVEEKAEKEPGGTWGSHFQPFKIIWTYNITVTYLPHKAVAEVSKDKEPIGRECAEFNWFESQLMSDSNELRVKWFGCHLIWDSNDFGCQLIWDSIDLVVNGFEIQMILVVNRCALQMILVVCWFELQVMRLSMDLRFKWFGCQLIWDSSDLVVNRIEIQMSWLSIALRFK